MMLQRQQPLKSEVSRDPPKNKEWFTTSVLTSFDYRCGALLALEENYLAASPFGAKCVFCFERHSGLTQGFSGVRLSVTRVR